ncbi:MAG: hypothetical protein KBC72_00445 [Acinetobacter sp.]|nr:hypothetical protein [Acinetobacter sp.]
MMNDKPIEAELITLPTTSPGSDALDIIEKRHAIFERVLSVAVAATGVNDWKDMGGKPYLEASGCEKAARRFGVSIYDVSVEREDLNDDNGRYYLYTVMGKASLGSESIEAIGTCSSRDKFFGAKKQMQDVDIANIKKKAYTNFMGNAVRKLLGLNNMTWDQLAKFGIGKGGNVTKVNYDKGASKADATKQAQAAQDGAKKPYWTSEWKGKNYVNARVGRHFSDEFLTNIGLFPSKNTAGCFNGIVTDDIMRALDDEFVAAEEILAKQEGGM